jgi:Na+-transporting NADH:ubiquinone oxidoreductase subunit NqrF
VKTKPRDRVQVVKEDNDELNVVDDVFQIDELVDTYRVAPSTNLEENLDFRLTENIFIDVDDQELNDILNQRASIQ